MVFGMCALAAVVLTQVSLDLRQTGVAHAENLEFPEIVALGPYARVMGKMARTGAVYMTLVGSNQDVRIVSASSPVAEQVELHDHIMNDGIMQMREIEAITVPAGANVELEPGGLHVMLLGLTQELSEGETFPLTLNFDSGDSMTFGVRVGGE
jgi:hypothetical protein